jgi:hypothetical protein
MGAPEDKGHAVFYATYRSVASVLQAEYDYSACTLNSGDSPSRIAGCGGSSSSFPGRFNVVDPNTGGLAGDFTIDRTARCVRSTSAPTSTTSAR